MPSAASFAYIGLSGHVLSVSEQTALQCSMVVLAKEHKAAVSFWGRLYGIEQDYLLVQVSGEDLLRTRRTLYSTDGGLHWHLLEPVTDQQRAYCDELRGLFVGNPSYEYKIKEDIPEDEQQQPQPEPVVASPEDPEESEGEKEEDEEDEEGFKEKEPVEEPAEESVRKPKRKKATYRVISLPEVVRLAWFVEDVDRNCSIIPRGAYLKNEHGNAVVNKTFEGLTAVEAGKLISYLHCRVPSQEFEKNALARESSHKNLDFLESIAGDIPDGVWNLKYEPSLGLVVGSNLLYEGFSFYHQPDTPIYGQYYFGNGLRNLDLCFML